MDKEEGLRENLIDIKAWQKIQNNFSNLTEINLRTVDPQGKVLTNPSKTNRLCNELIRSSGRKNSVCGTCLPTFLGGSGIVDKNLAFFCETSLCNFVAPLKAESGKIIAYTILGPVILVMRKSKDEYSEIARNLNLKPEDFLDTLAEIKVMSYQGMRAFSGLVGDIGEYTINLSLKSLSLPRLERIFGALLDAAFAMSRADIGSVMLFDDKRQNLSIHSSKGIPDEIVKNTRIKPGDGIAGIAAKEGASFLINGQNADNRIKPYLSRAHISSAMVLPLKIEDRVMGVMNLSALKNSGVSFNPDNLDLMRRLINLATIAIR